MADWGYDKGFIGSQYIDTRTAQQIEAERREWEGKKAQIKADEIVQYASPHWFCERHKNRGKTFIRCAHKGSRFVTQVMGYFDFAPEQGIVDYVDDAGEKGLTVQCIGFFDTLEQGNEYWVKGLELLKNDVPVGHN